MSLGSMLRQCLLACALLLSSGAVSADPPSYDLAADLLARQELARRELGPRVRTRVVQDVFAVFGHAGASPLIEGALSAYFNGRFDKRPERAVSVYVFADAAAYDAYCKRHLGSPCISSYGFYRPDLRRIVMNAGPGLGTLTHELVHPIMESDFPDAPTWLDEGIASLFEAPVIPRPGEIHGRKNWRYARLRRALADPQERQRVRVDALFDTSDAEFRGEYEDLNYALARYVCQWLDSKDELWPFYRAFRDGKAGDASGRQSFRAVVGVAPGAVNGAFVTWLEALR